MCCILLPKTSLPFRQNLMNSPRNNVVDVLPSKICSNFRKKATAEQVLLDFEYDYGFWHNYQCLKNENFSAFLFKEQFEYFEEINPQATIEDPKSLTNDVYNITSQKDMPDGFTQQNL